MMPTRRVPQRTCVTCRQVKPKRELVRIVRTPEGNVEIDRSGKKPGRGAYLCLSPECWQAGLKARRLAGALHGEPTTANLEKLSAEARDLLEGDH
ncbi:MAG: YlxR family protein [Chloroflexota bacterium]